VREIGHLRSRNVRSFLMSACMVLLSMVAVGQGSQPGKNEIKLRGQSVEIYYYPAAGQSRGTVLFAPGDGGWHGFAVDIAQQIASASYDVYGLETRRYLQTMKAEIPNPSPELIAQDYRTIGEWIRRRTKQRILLVGWSEGAGMGVVAASTENKDIFAGLVAIGITEVE
jgi:type IV secretory pathway VirJ component